jgi:hypothetical protein
MESRLRNVVKAANLPAAAEDTMLNMGHVKIVLQVLSRDGNLGPSVLVR